MAQVGPEYARAILNPNGEPECGDNHPLIFGDECAKPKGHANDKNDPTPHQNVQGFWWSNYAEPKEDEEP